MRKIRWLRDYTYSRRPVIDDAWGCATEGIDYETDFEHTFHKDEIIEVEVAPYDPPELVVAGIGSFSAFEGEDFEFIE